MAKLYAHSTNIAPPSPALAMVDGFYDRDLDAANEAEYKRKVKDELFQLGSTHAWTGKVIRFPVADNYAEYMVAKVGRKPAILVHLHICDGYRIPDAHVRGLTDTDIGGMIERQDRLDALFASPREVLS